MVAKSREGGINNDKECFIFGRRSTGYFDIRTLEGAKIYASASVKKLKLLERRKSLLWERRQTGSWSAWHSSTSLKVSGSLPQIYESRICRKWRSCFNSITQ